MATPVPTVHDRRAVIARLNRANGQLAAAARMVEEGRDCEEVVRLLAAVSKAVDTAALGIVFGGLRQCLIEDRADADEVTARLQKVLLSLA